MWIRRKITYRGNSKFFLVSLKHESLSNYYKTNFGLMQHHKYSLTELDNMIPWERQLYVGLLVQHLQDEIDRHKQAEANRKARR